jgi:hypothetical protein
LPYQPVDEAPDPRLQLFAQEVEGAALARSGRKEKLVLGAFRHLALLSTLNTATAADGSIRK